MTDQGRRLTGAPLGRTRASATHAAAAAVAATLLAGAVVAVVHGQSGGPRGVLQYGISQSMIEDVNPNDALAATLVLTRELVAGSSTFKDARAQLFPDVASLERAVNGGSVDVVAISTLDFLAIESTLKADPALIYGRRDGGDAGLALVARSDVKTVGALSGRRVSVCNPTGQVPSLAQMWLSVLTSEAGVPDGSVQLQQVKKASQAVLAAFFGQADAAVVPASAFETSVELNPQLGKQLSVISRSAPLLSGLMCIRRSLEPESRRWVVKQATGVHERPFSRETFVVLRVSRMVPFDPPMIDPVRALLVRYNALRRGAVRR